MLNLLALEAFALVRRHVTFHHSSSALRRIRVVPERILLSNLPILPVSNELAVVAAGNLAPRVDGFFLCSMLRENGRFAPPSNRLHPVRDTAETARIASEEARIAAETARNASEDARAATDAAREAVVDAVRATADTMNASLEQMKVVEEMRRTLREIRDVNKLDSN